MRRRGAGVILVACCCVMGACSRPPAAAPEDLMSQAEYLVREERWADAIPVLKQYLLSHPEDSGAHFYLGRCWLNVESFNGRDGPWLVLAEGELRLARQLFQAGGRRSTIKRFSDTYFEVICNIERAKVYLRQLTYLADHQGRLAGATVQSIVASLRDAVADAKAVDPDSPDVASLEGILQSIGAGSGR